MNRKGFPTVAAIVIVASGLAIASAAVYFGPGKAAPSMVLTTPPANTQGVASSAANSQTSQPLSSSMPPFSFSCPQSSTTLTAYEDPQMGVAFCYPAGLAVTTGTITWEDAFGTPQMSFWILHEASPMNTVSAYPNGGPQLFYDLADCDASGSNGEDYCVFPKPAQIAMGDNPNGFNWVSFRHDIVNQKGTNDVTVLYDNGGPSAFVPLIDHNYLVFTAANSLHQAKGFISFPTSTDADLKEILNTVALMPQRYTGVGLTLTNATSGIRIYNVIKNSPADAAGITAGELVVGFNGTFTSNMTADVLTNLLAKATGTVSVSIQNGTGRPASFSLTPQTFWVSGSDLGAMYENPF